MIKVSLSNFALITFMAMVGILVVKSIFGVFPVKGLTEFVYAV